MLAPRNPMLPDVIDANAVIAPSSRLWSTSWRDELAFAKVRHEDDLRRRAERLEPGGGGNKAESPAEDGT
jgi:hypothetical protein